MLFEEDLVVFVLEFVSVLLVGSANRLLVVVKSLSLLILPLKSLELLETL